MTQVRIKDLTLYGPCISFVSCMPVKSFLRHTNHNTNYSDKQFRNKYQLTCWCLPFRSFFMPQSIFVRPIFSTKISNLWLFNSSKFLIVAWVRCSLSVTRTELLYSKLASYVWISIESRITCQGKTQFSDHVYWRNLQSGVNRYHWLNSNRHLINISINTQSTSWSTISR